MRSVCFFSGRFQFEFVTIPDLSLCWSVFSCDVMSLQLASMIQVRHEDHKTVVQPEHAVSQWLFLAPQGQRSSGYGGSGYGSGSYNKGWGGQGSWGGNQGSWGGQGQWGGSSGYGNRVSLLTCLEDIATELSHVISLYSCLKAKSTGYCWSIQMQHLELQLQNLHVIQSTFRIWKICIGCSVLVISLVHQFCLQGNLI